MRCGAQAALIVDMMRAAGFLEQTGVPGVTLGPKLLVGHSLGGACAVANSATIAGVMGAAVMAPAVRPIKHLKLALQQGSHSRDARHLVSVALGLPLIESTCNTPMRTRPT